MTGTFRSWTQLIKQTNKGKNSHRAFGYVYAAEVGAAVDPMKIEGWQDIGLPVTLPKFTKSVGKEQIKSGLPGGLLINLPTEDIRELEFAFSHYRLWTMQLATANTAAIDVRVSTTGQTTVASGATKTGCTVTSGTGLAVGDTIYVDCSDATLGGFPEITVITAKNGAAIEFEPLPSVPATGAFVKKVAGATTGTNKDDTGIHIPDPVTMDFPRVQLLVAFNLPSNKSLMLVHIKEFEITGGNAVPDFSQPIATVIFMGNPILQDAKTYTLTDGTTQDLYYYDDVYIVPYES